MKKPLISIIVPVYNVEKYLNECLESIVNQTYENLEIILVDDGSSDNSGKICDEFALKDSRIKVIHKKNGGLSSARNSGIDIANGEYLSFIDSDDMVDRNFILTLFSLIQKSSLELSSVGFKAFFKSENLDELPDKSYEKIISDEEYFKNIFIGNDDFRCASCKFLFHKSLFENSRFPVGELYEDVAIFGEIMVRAKKVIMSDERLYFYRMRDGSIVHSFSPRHFDFLKQAEILVSIATNKYPNLTPITKYYLSSVRMAISFDILKSNSLEFDSFLKKSTKFIRENFTSVFRTKSLNKKTKILVLILGLSSSLFKLIYRIFGGKK